jgi:hypothetical protein
MDPSQDDSCPETGAHWWTATGHERPVFLDERGRRRRWVLAGGVLAGALAALWLTALLAGAVGFSSLPLAHGPELSARPHIADLRRTTADLRRDRDRT